MQLIVGTYTETLPHVVGKADGVLSVEFDAGSGSFGIVRMLAAMRNPSYLVVSSSGENVYAVSEVTEFEGEPGGGVVAFARDARTGELTLLNARGTGGTEPCFVTLDRSGRFVLTANYGSGSVSVYPVEDDGRLGEMADYAAHTGSGPNSERQESAHTHMAGIDPVTGDVHAIDLGADTIFAYAIGSSGDLLAGAPPLKTAPGAGPRHLAFHPAGQHVFVANELGGTVTTLRRQAEGFEPVAETATIPAGTGIENLPGAIRVSPSGRHVLVSNRGHDSISVFRFAPGTERLALIGTIPAEGECPRDFVLTPDGTKIIVASQDSDVIASYAFDDSAGTLRLLRKVAAPTPVCLALA